jgi:hypothetical protein
MDSDDDYLYDATDSGNESPEGGEDEEDHVRTFFLNSDTASGKNSRNSKCFHRSKQELKK